MDKDFKFILSSSATAKSLEWTEKEVAWEEFATQLSKAKVTHETHDEFMAMTKEQQGRVKDVGAFVGGRLSGGRRRKNNLQFRSLLSLDIDFGNMDYANNMKELLGDTEFIIHGTHKHSEDNPRFRLLAPMSRDLDPTEYEAVARKIAELSGMELYDPSTFQPERCMFYPSVSTDTPYYYIRNAGEPLDVDKYLGMYDDPGDMSKWCYPEGHKPDLDNKGYALVREAENPIFKNNLVGAFCRAYTISEAIDKFLSDVYKLESDGRYTYIGGSTTGGMITFDDTFAYSYHGTDPICTGNVYNAYDLVRIHLFTNKAKKDLDANDIKRSEAKMLELCNKDQTVVKEHIIAKQKIAEEKIETEKKARLEKTLQDAENLEWDMDKKGNYLPTARNFCNIFRSDKELVGLIAYNEFIDRTLLTRVPFWRKDLQGLTGSDVSDTDLSVIRTYIETKYGINNEKKLNDAITVIALDNRFHPVKEYIDSVFWDGKERVETWFIDYLEAEDNIYTREATKVMLVAAVERIFNPGCKFDNALILVAGQGVGKSTLLDRMGSQWYTDSVGAIGTDKAYESIRGKWIVELAELAGMDKRRTTVEDIKHFLSKTEDSYRPAYGRNVVNQKRQCVFFGTTNRSEFLRDATGDRRFYPITCHATTANPDIFSSSIEYEVSQLWAEARMLQQKGVKLVLSREAELVAEKARGERFEEDERTGLIMDYLDMEIPDNWSSMDEAERKAYLEFDRVEGTGSKRNTVTIMEIAVECLGYELVKVDNKVKNEIKDILVRTKVWRKASGDNGRVRTPYGRLAAYIRN